MNSLSDEDVSRLFGVLLAELRTLSLTKARSAVAAAGITGINAPAQYWDPFHTGVERVFYQLGPESRLAALRILADQFADRENVRSLFARSMAMNIWTAPSSRLASSISVRPGFSHHHRLPNLQRR
jgi:hypothetical protein